MTFSLVTAAVVWAILDSTSGLDPSSDTRAPRYLKLQTVSSFLLSMVMSVLMPLVLFVISWIFWVHWVMQGALDRGSTFGGWLLHSTWKGGRASLVLIHPLNLSCAGSKPFDRRAEPREGVMLTQHHLAQNLHDAGFQLRRMKFPQEFNGYVFKTKASHLDGGHRLWSGMKRDGLRHTTLPKTHHMKMTTTTGAKHG